MKLEMLFIILCAFLLFVKVMQSSAYRTTWNLLISSSLSSSLSISYLNIGDRFLYCVVHFSVFSNTFLLGILLVDTFLLTFYMWILFVRQKFCHWLLSNYTLQRQTCNSVTVHHYQPLYGTFIQKLLPMMGII